MISVKNIVKNFGEHRAVGGISFEVPRGAVFGFLGANGAGKTTMIKMLAGISRPDSGEISVGGKNPRETAARERIGFFPETPSFYEYLTGREFLAFAQELSQKNSQKFPSLSLSGANAKILREKRETLLEEMGIARAGGDFIRTYSKGMRQRLGFAAAIIHDPDYIFLDEPLDGLDPLGRKHLKEIIKKLKAREKTVFFSSHILFDAEELCDMIGVIHRGKLLYSGETKIFTAGKSLEEKFVEVVERQSEK